MNTKSHVKNKQTLASCHISLAITFEKDEQSKDAVFIGMTDYCLLPLSQVHLVLTQPLLLSNPPNKEGLNSSKCQSQCKSFKI